MDGIHDMGGMHCMGPMIRETDEPVFHADWERRMFGVMLSLIGKGQFSVDSFRYAIERMEPAEYLQTSYYEHWLHAVETLLRERGVIPGEANVTIPVDQSRVKAARVIAARVDADIPASFKTGETVIAHTAHKVEHTRLPRYARGRRGTIVADHGVFLYPDTYATEGDPKPQHVYSVRFEGTEIWGKAADPKSAIHLDLFEDYLGKA